MRGFALVAVAAAHDVGDDGGFGLFDDEAVYGARFAVAEVVEVVGEALFDGVLHSVACEITLLSRASVE